MPQCYVMHPVSLPSNLMFTSRFLGKMAALSEFDSRLKQGLFFSFKPSATSTLSPGLKWPNWDSDKCFLPNDDTERTMPPLHGHGMAIRLGNKCTRSFIAVYISFSQ